jgi:predicted dehydrogenase
VRIGCLGAARIAPTALVHPARVRGGAHLAAVAARDPARAEAFAALHGFERAEASYEALIAAADIDLIYNALPINLHAPWTIRALEAGKHVLCEKPFAMNAAEAEAMVTAAAASGRRVIEAFHYRYHPAFAQLLAWIGAGEIGEVRAITATFHVGIPDRDGTEIRHLPETGGGAFMDLGCYTLSWALQVMHAAPVAVTAAAILTARGVDETLEANLTFESGATAALSASMAMGQPLAASLEITGTSGAVSFLNPLAPQRGARLALTAGGRTRAAPVSRLATYVWQLDSVLTALESGEALPTEGEAILRQQRAIDAVYQAAGLRSLRQPGAAG